MQRMQKLVKVASAAVNASVAKAPEKLPKLPKVAMAQTEEQIQKQIEQLKLTIKRLLKFGTRSRAIQGASVWQLIKPRLMINYCLELFYLPPCSEG